MQTYKKGNLDISYTYDADGLRASKIVVEKTPTYEHTYNYAYQYVGDKLYYLCAKEDGATSYEMYFFYDSYGKLTVLKYFKHTGENPGEYTYYVATNYFGDVVALYAGDGSIRASYEYDAWGNLIAVYDKDGNLNENLNSLAHRNPIRYRSYCYDQETGLYYLQSRYYNAEVGRFLNSDNISDPGAGVLGYNTFLYCANNPVNASDPSGHKLSWKAKLVSVVAVAVAVVAATVATVLTFGAGSVAGVAMISFAATYALRTVEVASLQYKKTRYKQKNQKRVSINKSIEAIYHNTGNIIAGPLPGKSLGVSANLIISNKASQIFHKVSMPINDALRLPGGKLFPLLGVGSATVQTAISIFSDNVEKRAEKRGFDLL